jgi:hypothetical protein
MRHSRTGPLRKAQDVSLARTSLVTFELHRPEEADGAASLVAVFHDAAGGGLALVTDDRGLMIDPAGTPAGTVRIIVAVEAAAGAVARIHGVRCTVRDDQGSNLAVLSGPAAGETTPDPVHLLGECYRRQGEWRFREIGYGLADDAAITRALGPGAAAHHRRRAAALVRSEEPDRVAGPGPESPRVTGEARPARGLPPPNLAAARIGGERTARGPVSLEVAVDLSGSMYRYSDLRTAALRALAGFARREMAAGDLLTSVAFADRAAILVPPVDVRKLGRVTDRPSRDVGGGTWLSPAIRLLMELRARGCVEPYSRALMVITDVALQDDGRTLGRLLHQAAYQHVHLVVPEPEGVLVPPGPLRRAAVHRFTDADQLGLIYGAVFAAMTGQRLERR